MIMPILTVLPVVKLAVVQIAVVEFVADSGNMDIISSGLGIDFVVIVPEVKSSCSQPNMMQIAIREVRKLRNVTPNL